MYSPARRRNDIGRYDTPRFVSRPGPPEVTAQGRSGQSPGQHGEGDPGLAHSTAQLVPADNIGA